MVMIRPGTLEMKAVGMCVLTLALLAVCAPAPGGEKKAPSPLIGKPAPPIAAEYALNGVPASLADLKGKVVVLDFWAIWCPHCRDMVPLLRQLSTSHDDVRVISISGSGERDATREVLQDFAARHEMYWLLLRASAREMAAMARAYRVTGYPHVVLIDRRGIVRQVLTGYGGSSYDDYVTALVTRLLAERP